MSDSLMLPRPLPVHTDPSPVGAEFDVEMCLYGTEEVGFAYYLSDQAGLAPTHGRGSYYDRPTWESVDTCPTIENCVRHAVTFIEPGAIVQVFDPDGVPRWRASARDLPHVVVTP